MPGAGCLLTVIGDTGGMTKRTPMAAGFFCLLIVAGIGACAKPPGFHGSIEEFLRSQPGRFGAVMQDPARHRLQIIYTQIDRDADNRPAFRSFRYRVDENEYFYPASTVKLPVALLALEKLDALAIAGLDRDTAMLTGSTGEPQTHAWVDDSSPNGLPSVAHYIRKILLVSDNDAFNRLYEFVGQRAINESLRQKGFTGTRIMHRLESAMTVAENQLTNPVSFVSGDTVVYHQDAQSSDTDYSAPAPIPLGVAEIVDGERVPGPKDFAGKNAFPLQDLHDTLKVLLFPEAVDAKRRFMLTDENYDFVYRYLSMYPGNSGIDIFRDAAVYPDAYVKFLMFGGKAADIPDHLRIFNKVGDAYGFLTDAAYIVDVERGVEFMLAATIYTNDNGIFNDDHYEYDERGLPFLRDLGTAFYEVELARSRAVRPDFSRYLGSEQRPDNQQEADEDQRDAERRANNAQ